MTGLHDKRASGERRRSKRLERSRPEAAAAAPHVTVAPPTAPRADVPVPPRKCEHSVPAARVARSQWLPRGERDSEDVAPAPPPPKRSRSVRAYGDQNPMDLTAAPPTAPCAEAPVPPPRSAYALRNRYIPGTSNHHVPDTSNHKPYIPERNKKKEEPKRDRPCSSRKKLEQDKPWEAPACARAGLEHYNSMNQEDEHELVEAVDVNPFILCGMWLHANFLARRKGGSNCVDHFPKHFFAELKLDAYGLHCASCVKIGSAESKNIGACKMCPRSIMHPACGEYYGGKSESAAVSCHGGFLQPVDGSRRQIDFSF